MDLIKVFTERLKGLFSYTPFSVGLGGLVVYVACYCTKNLGEYGYVPIYIFFVWLLCAVIFYSKKNRNPG